MGNFKNRTFILALTMFLALAAGAIWLGRNKHSVSSQTEAPIPSGEFAVMTADRGSSQAKQARRKKARPVLPAEVAVSTGTALEPEVVVDTAALAKLPSAQEEVGNDLAVLRSRFEIKNEFINGPGEGDSNSVVTRLDGAVNRKLAFRIDMPYVMDLSNVSQPGVSQGWGDLLLRGSAVIKKTPWAGFTGLCDFWFDTAEARNLGSGKDSIGPAIAANLKNSVKDLMVSAVVQQKVSYGGDSSRNDINRSKVELTFDDSHFERVWLQMTAAVFYDWAISKKSAGNLEFEVGTRLTHLSLIHI